MVKYVKTEQGYQKIEKVNSNKMDKNNPVGTGSFSMGRKYGSLIGLDSHAEGNNTTASGPYSHAEGYITTASGNSSHAEGYRTTASGVDSHAEGISTTASGEYSHAEGSYTIASGFDSHAEGNNTTASGSYSHVEGYNTTAGSQYQHVQGRYNVVDSQHKYSHIVGNGSSDTSRSNAHTLDWNGVGWFKNSVKVGGVSQDDSAAKTLATTEYVDTTVSTKISGKQDTLIQSGATVGQIAKITAVDDTGKPTAWEAVDMPSGGGSGGVSEEVWRLVRTITTTEEVASVEISTDEGGQIFSLKKIWCRLAIKGSDTNSANGNLRVNLNANQANTAARIVDAADFVQSVSGRTRYLEIQAEPCTTEERLYGFYLPIGAAAKGESSQVYSLRDAFEYFESYQTVSSMCVYSKTGEVFGAGTTIELWGVDA